MKRATDLCCWLEIKANTLKEKRPYKKKNHLRPIKKTKSLYLMNNTLKANSNALRQYKKTIALNQMQREAGFARALY